MDYGLAAFVALIAAVIIILFGLRRDHFAVSGIDCELGRTLAMLDVDLPNQVAILIVQLGFQHLAGLHLQRGSFGLLLAHTGQLH